MFWSQIASNQKPSFSISLSLAFGSALTIKPIDIRKPIGHLKPMGFFCAQQDIATMNRPQFVRIAEDHAPL